MYLQDNFTKITSCTTDLEMTQI